MAQALGGAHVEPDAEVGADVAGRDRTKDGALIPPDAGREDGEFGEDLGVGEAEVERDEAAERGAAERGVGGVGQGAELAVDAGLQLLDEETAVEVAVAATEARVAGGRVLCHAAEAGVVDADEDDRLDQAGASEAVGGGVCLPGVVGDVGGAAVEEVLAVMEIEDGEPARGVVDVGFRQVDFDVASLRQEVRLELPEDEIARVVVELVRGREIVVRTRSRFERRETLPERSATQGRGG